MVRLQADASGHVQLMLFRKQKFTQARQVTETVNGKTTTKIVHEQVERIGQQYVLVETMNAKCVTVRGVEIPSATVMKRAEKGLTVYISADGKPVSKCWLRMMDPEAVIVMADGLQSLAAPRSLQHPEVPPRLARLGTDASGKVQVAYNPAGLSSPNNMASNRVVFMNGLGARQVMFNDYAYGYSGNTTPSATVAPVKSLDQIKFEAYDLTGKRVAKAEAFRQLQAGGFALIAGDDSVPDAAFLKMYRGDLLVLVSPELMNVPTGKKGQAGIAAPIPLPAVRAGAVRVLVRPAAVLKVAPVEKK